MKRLEPHISDTGYRRSPQQVAQNQNLVDFVLFSTFAFLTKNYFKGGL
jgi:hypothetical protein